MKKGSFFSRSRRITGVDLPFLAGVLLLLGIGLATLYSAGYAKALQKTGNSYFYISRQGIFAVGGLIVMAIASWFPYKYYKKLSLLLYVVSVALLGAVLFLSNDTEKRWLYIGGFQFQPSEIAKVAVIMLLAAYLSNPKLRVRNFWRGIVIPGVIFGLCAFLVGIEPHLSGAILVAAIGFMMVVASGANVLHMVPIGVLAAAAGIALYFSEEYMQKRVYT